MTAGVLADLLVVDSSDGVAGQFAGRLLAEHGARVVLVEPRAGSSIRRRGPFRRSGANAGQSLLFRHLNTGKESICLDIDLLEDRRRLDALTARADVIIDDRGVPFTHGERAIVCRVTEFTPGGPYEHWRGAEMIHQALSGLMFTTGRKDARPLYGFGHRAYYSAGAAAAVAILGALIERDASSRGAQLAISVHETAVAMSQNLVAQASYNGTYPVRGRYPGAVDVFRCRDGWATFYCRGDRWKAWCTELGALDAATDPRFAKTDGIVSNWDDAYRMLAPHVARLTVDDFVARTEAARALAARIYSLHDVRACAHLATRHFWESVQTPAGPRSLLGPLFRMHGTPRHVGADAPALNAHRQVPS